LKKAVLIIGPTPADHYSGDQRNAFHYRCQQFLSVFLENNFAVIIVSINKKCKNPWKINKLDNDVIQFIIGDQHFRLGSKLKKFIKSKEFSAVLAIGLGNALYCTRYVRNIPFWIDFYGDPLVEKIGRNSINNKANGTFFLRKCLKKVIIKADKLSVCSESQKDLLVGALFYFGILGHLNWNESIVNVIEYFGANYTINGQTDKISKHGQEEVNLLYNGSINTWTDVKLLSNALLNTLRKRNNVNFVQFGFSVAGQEVLQDFKSGLNDVEVLDRVKFLGRISENDAKEIYNKSHICISADLDSLETRYGWRTRYLSAMREGLVVAATLGNDLANILSTNHLGMFSKPGFLQEFEKNLLCTIDDRDLRKKMTGGGFHFLQILHGNNAQFIPFVQWFNDPYETTKLRESFFIDLIEYLRSIFSYGVWLLLSRNKL
jgi:glycosyltransferase involved in cell wall biosynthesis